METNSSSNTHRRLQELVSQVNYHNYRYHVMDDALISDYEYDQLVVELRQIEQNHPDWITPESPTQRAGGPPASRFTKVRHPAHVLSLANAFDAQGIEAWFDRISKVDDRVEKTDFIVEPKIDGLTVVLHYRDGNFIQGATRGDGEIGEDITANLRTVSALPLKLPVDVNGPVAPALMVVRGEAFIKIREFEQLNKKLAEAGEKTYQNPRNTAAGALRQLDSSLTASRPLTLLVYAIISGEGDFPETQKGRLEALRTWGFPVSQAVYCQDLADVILACKELTEARDTLDFEADGAVIKINDLRLADELGFVGKDPRGALAFKFPAREITTQLLGIGVNVGRTGVLTPYAILEPAEIGGVIVKQATLHNFDYIAEKDIRPGDRVTVKRAGDVIPYIIGPVTSARNGTEKAYIPPVQCPACNERVEHFEGEVAWYCVNAACPAQLIRHLEHFVSRGALDIVGMGIKIVEQLANEGLVNDVADLYRLQKDDLLKLEGFADKKVDNLLSAIQNSRRQPLPRLITALGIPGVGEVMATDLATKYPDLDTLSAATLDELQEIDGVGPNIAQAIVNWFSRQANRQLLEKLRNFGVWPHGDVYHPSDQVMKTLENATFVVTGTLPGFSRDEVKEFIEIHGGKVVDSVSKKTSYLVLGDNPGSKFSKAQSFEVPIIDEAGLRHLAAGS